MSRLAVNNPVGGSAPWGVSLPVVVAAPTATATATVAPAYAQDAWRPSQPYPQAPSYAPAYAYPQANAGWNDPSYQAALAQIRAKQAQYQLQSAPGYQPATTYQQAPTYMAAATPSYGSPLATLAPPPPPPPPPPPAPRPLNTPMLTPPAPPPAPVYTVSQPTAPQAPAAPAPGPTAPRTIDPAQVAALSGMSAEQLKQLGKTDKKAFLEALRPGAEEAERIYGVPAAVTLAQAALETGWGQHIIPGFNVFGIKGKGTAGSVNLGTSEVYGGKTVKIKANFARYNNFYEGVMAHGKLFHNGYYKKAMNQFAQDHDPYAFARNITGVYATDPNYGSKLSSIMRQYNLA